MKPEFLYRKKSLFYDNYTLYGNTIYRYTLLRNNMQRYTLYGNTI